jgi:hypothetical protein
MDLKDSKETPKVHISSRAQFQGLVFSGDRDQHPSPPAKLQRPRQLSVNGQSAKNGPNPPQRRHHRPDATQPFRCLSPSIFSLLFPTKRRSTTAS